jgi:hypothetical protein
MATPKKTKETAAKEPQITYAKILDQYKPALEILGELDYADNMPVSHLLNIAENLKMIDDKGVSFWKTREKLLDTFVEKDSEGKNKTKVGKHPQTGEPTSEFVLTEKNQLLWLEKFEELRQTKVDIELNKLDKKHFEGAKGLKVSYLRGVFDLLK